MRLFKVLLCATIMMLAFTAQPYGKNADVRNKSSGTELIMQYENTVDQYAVADVLVLDSPAETPVEIQYAVYITNAPAKEDGDSPLKVQPGDLPRRQEPKMVTDFVKNEPRWKDIHRRS